MKTAVKLLIFIAIIAMAAGVVRYFISKEPVSPEPAIMKSDSVAQKEASSMVAESSSIPYHYLLPRWYK